ncbi:endonuclease III domain-containing protein [Candidatus Methanomassiliicoccus intestinalis]|uniref:endonuclease III domain-containing protein n=1 Tax=Candidatus Methanomassiliicoccus intestinalis TaxID=1406512 RepID=UPI0037DCE7C9
MSQKISCEVLDRLTKFFEGTPSPTALAKNPTWHATPFTVLISTVLSQRNRDEITYAASEKLFARYPGPAELMNADLEELNELISNVNFHFNKAKAIKEIARILCEDYGGEVPKDINELVKLPMVGRKTANCLLGYAYHIASICVDTHVHRISNRLGLVNSKTPEETEMQLQTAVPKTRWLEINDLFVRFGQEVCTPQRPKHEQCPLQDLCLEFKKEVK